MGVMTGDEGRISDINRGHTGICTLTQVEGHQLKIRSSVAFPLATLVRAEIGNNLWMGEVCACQSDPAGFNVEIHIESFLSDVAGVEVLAARFRHERSISPNAKPDSASLVSNRRDIP